MEDFKLDAYCPKCGEYTKTKVVCENRILDASLDEILRYPRQDDVIKVRCGQCHDVYGTVIYYSHFDAWTVGHICPSCGNMHDIAIATNPDMVRQAVLDIASETMDNVKKNICESCYHAMSKDRRIHYRPGKLNDV